VAEKSVAIACARRWWWSRKEKIEKIEDQGEAHWVADPKNHFILDLWTKIRPKTPYNDKKVYDSLDKINLGKNSWIYKHQKVAKIHNHV
jgi:hypothetical protein